MIMRGIPDFVPQVQDIERRLKSEWHTVQEGWQDSVAEGFNEGVMEPYVQNFHQYITGEGLDCYGLEQLLQQMDSHLQQMESLTN
jgi:hypothetical protein